LRLENVARQVDSGFPTRVWYEIAAPYPLPLQVYCTSLNYGGKRTREIEPEGLCWNWGTRAIYFAAFLRYGLISGQLSVKMRR
jgi:hypothetical protein